MSRTNLLGNVPLIKTGMNKGRLDRPALAEQRNLSLKEVYKAYNNWIQIFRIEGSTLTFEEYLNKMKETGISPFDLGNDNHNYHLSRFNDEGPYTNESCRFVSKYINMNEQTTNYVLNKYGPVAEGSMARDF